MKTGVYTLKLDQLSDLHQPLGYLYVYLGNIPGKKENFERENREMWIKIMVSFVYVRKPHLHFCLPCHWLLLLHVTFHKNVLS